MLSKLPVMLLISCICAAQGTSPQPKRHLASDSEIRQLLAGRVHAIAGKDDGIGIVVGIVSLQGRRIVSYGHSDRTDARPLTGDSIFEIGSVGKVFTALVLAELVQRGEAKLSDRVSKYLPVGSRIPEHNGHQITLADLATHTSGLPFMPDTYPTIGGTDRFGSRDMYDFLARYQLKRDPGSEWEYSNIGYWLLGQAMANRAGLPYDELLRRSVFQPLGMNSTEVTLPEKLKWQLAQGHDASLQPALPFYGLSVYSTMGAAAGGVYSTVNDLLTFLSATLGLEKSPLKPSMDAMLGTRRPIEANQQALGWIVEGRGDDEFYFHDGGTWGYASAIAWDPEERIGVVVLSNQQQSVADIARHLLRPTIPLSSPNIAKHKESAMTRSALDVYAGRYIAEGVGVFNIAREGNYLTLQVPLDWGLPKFRLHPESKKEFFVREVPIHVTFQTNEKRALIFPPRGQHGIPITKTVTSALPAKPPSTHPASLH